MSSSPRLVRSSKLKVTLVTGLHHAIETSYQLCTKDRKDVFLTKDGPFFKLKVSLATGLHCYIENSYQPCTRDRKDVFLTKDGPLLVGKPLAVVMLLRLITNNASRIPRKKTCCSS